MNNAKTILVVEDEKDMSHLLRFNLERAGYKVLIAEDGEAALQTAAKEELDAVLLDLRLPNVGGLNVLRDLKSQDATSDVPVIIVSALGSEDDIVLGLNLGADDYVTKPFGMREMIARVAATIRRKEMPVEEEEVITVGDVSINRSRHVVEYEGKSIELTPSEFDILTVLAKRPGRVFTRRQLCEQALRSGETVMERTVDAHIKSLRQKLGDLGRKVITVWGVGYKYEDV